MKLGIISTSICLLWVSCLTGADWPGFRGPGGSGSSGETGLPDRWSRTENLRWMAELPGRGLANPVIAAGKVYVTACSGFEQERLHVLCFDAKNGKRLWQRQLQATGNTMCHAKTCMAAPTPVTDGKHVFALFATGDLVCFDAAGGLVWYRSLVQDYPTVGNNVGMAASPILANDTLLLALENAGESFALGIDARTGRNRWKIERSREINWVTPVVRVDGENTEVLFQSAKEISAHDVRTGEQRWSYADTGLGTIPSATLAPGLVLVPAGDRLLALRVGKSTPQLVWQSPKARTKFASPLYYQDHVYTVSYPVGIVTCVSAADGKLLWQTERLKGAYSASPVAAEGKLYLVNEEGVTTVLQTGAKPLVLATNDLGEPMLASPAIADGALFLRSDQHLFCIAEKAKK